MKGGRYELTQKEMVLGYIRDFGSITPVDAFRDLGIARLAAVVCKLRREGHDIHKEREHALNRSCIIDTGVHIQLPHGYVGMLKSKSGLNVMHDITSEGVIDEGYSEQR